MAVNLYSGIKWTSGKIPGTSLTASDTYGMKTKEAYMYNNLDVISDSIGGVTEAINQMVAQVAADTNRARKAVLDATAVRVNLKDLEHGTYGTILPTVHVEGTQVVTDPTKTMVLACDADVIKTPVRVKTKKFKIGEHYIIYPMKNKKLKREYVVKKTVYTIQDKEVNIVIMKQVNGPTSTKFTLNKEDCLKFHLKFEEGLEVFSMELDWKLIKTK